MARPKFSDEQKKREGAALEALFEYAQAKDPQLSQESLAGEMEVSQGLISQWFKGVTPIPDRRLLWLGARLKFDPAVVRPDIELLAQLSGLEGSAKLAQVIRSIPKGEEDYIASILAPIVEALKRNR